MSGQRRHIKLLRIVVGATFMLMGLLSLAVAQQSALEGRVTDEGNAVLPGALIELKRGDVHREAVTDLDGLFHVRGLETGKWFIRITHVGFFAHEDSVSIPFLTPLVVRMKEEVRQLGDVQVMAKSDSRRVAEQSVIASVASTRDVALQSVTVTELMGRTSGVRIRQTGGLGASADVSVNGYQGRSVRYFKDGIPLSYLQDGYSIAAVPVNVLDRVEVYKGVLPVALGADALGGAVNLVTRDARGRQASASLEAGSFQTYRFALNGVYSGVNDRWFAGGEAFFNISENNYSALVNVTDPETRNQVPARVSLFHNGYRGYFAEAFAGIRNRGWADELRLSLAVFEVEREQQHPALMTDPYGAVQSQTASLVPSLRYRKELWNNRLRLDQFVAANVLQVNRTDTVKGRYDWYGQFIPNPQVTGESRQPSLSDVDLEHITSRTNMGFTLSEAHNLEANLVYTSISRSGSDPLGPRFYGTDIDVLSVASTYQKMVAVLGLRSHFMQERLETLIMAKYYRYTSEGAEAWQGRAVTMNDITRQSAGEPGLGAAVKYNVNASAFVRVSAESSNRLPEQDELFGDGVWIVPNFGLSPERSMNVNLGFRKEHLTAWALELNSFFRRAQGMILLVPVQPPYAQYANMEDIRGFGMEADWSVQLPLNLRGSLNATWQNMRLNGDFAGADQWKNGARLRNTPYFFCNAGLTGNYEHVFSRNDRLRTSVNYGFVREFYLETIPRRFEPGGFLGLSGSAGIQTDLIIPNQHVVHAGVGYQPSGGRIMLGLDLKNLLNADVYDNYRVQRPGRSFHIKLSYQLQGRS